MDIESAKKKIVLAKLFRVKICVLAILETKDNSVVYSDDNGRITAERQVDTLMQIYSGRPESFIIIVSSKYYIIY